MNKTIQLSALALLLAGCNSDSSNSGPETTLANEWDSRSTYSSQLNLSGTATDDDSVDSVTVALNGVETELVLVNDAFSTSLTLKPGLNKYSLTATDSLGNSTTLTDSIYFGHQVSAGGAHSGAIIDGQLGQTGLGALIPFGNDAHPTTPKKLDVISDGELVTFVSLAFNQNASAALDDEGKVWTWGDGDGGQLGLGTDDGEITEDDELTPQKVASLSNIISIARGYDHTVVLDNSGNVYTFGENDKGQLGINSTEESDFPVRVEISDIVQIEAGSDSTYALDVNGNLYGWGENDDGQLAQGEGNADDILIPTLIDTPERIVSFAAGKAHVIALGTSGQLYGWGLNASNQIGNDEDDTWADEFFTVQALPWVTDGVMVWANGNQSFVEKADGKIYPWGFNGLGTLGLETDTSPIAPTIAITDLDSVVDLGAGALHTVTIRNDHTAFSWGWSFEGSLGVANPIDRWGYSLPQVVTFE